MEVIITANNTDNFDLEFAIQVALLHDTMEDTATNFEELENTFGMEIAKAVSALTKDQTLPKEIRMQDSLSRIKKLQPEVWAVKIADRITNLQPPPSHWDAKKKIKYQEEAQIIYNDLKAGNDYLARRLEAKIVAYGKYIN